RKSAKHSAHCSRPFRYWNCPNGQERICRLSPHPPEATMTIAAEREGIQYHVLMVSFEGRKTASEIVDRLKGEGAFRECEVEAEAFVWRDEDGKVHLHERGGAGAGAAFGATAMGIVSILGGPL